jgi:uncharacterized protein (TIGR00369 family)
MGVLDEPVRGLVPPPWFHALGGLERIRALSSSLVPGPPGPRLFGLRAVHVGPGLAVTVMPASETATMASGQVEVWPLVSGALTAALTTVVGPGQVAKPLSFSLNHFRPTRPGTTNLLARARVVNASSLFAYAEVLVEDSEGRQLGHGGGQVAIVSLDPAPPPPPSPLPSIEEPTWPTPDPWQRPVEAGIPLSLWDTTPGIEMARQVASGALRVPLCDLLDAKIRDLAHGSVTMLMPASEWFCGDVRETPVGILATLANLAGNVCGLTLHKPGMTLAGLDCHVRFLHAPPADRQWLRAEARVEAITDGTMVVATTIHDADGTVACTANASAALLDNTRRGRARRRSVERLLCTILFTDIVGSTARAEALGDAAWHTLLERHHETARREIAFCQGREVKSTGDGLLVRFSSPARALECATRLRRALAALGIEIRAGLHTGECEVADDDIVGMAVHLAARIQAAAEPGEILASSTVKDLAAGAGHRFESRGEHHLKGIDEPWRLWAVG